MSDLTNIQFPPPANWQDFERLCHALWQEIWADPNAQLNGRTGQPQAGVDVYGLPKRAAKYEGIQCKGKDGRYGAVITEDELRSEVDKAKRFKPPLRNFVLATTANSDAKIQEVARLLTTEHRTKGLFDVAVLAWPEIQARLSHHPRVIDCHFPAHSDIARKALIAVTKLGESPLPASQGKDNEILSNVLALRQDFQNLTIPQQSADFDRELAAEIDHCRELLNNKQPATALTLLEALKNRIWPIAKPSIRFRILTNIAAAQLAIGKEADAAQNFLVAFDYDSSSEKAHSNRVLAYLIRGEKEEAVLMAEEATRTFPESALAWGALVKALGVRGDNVDYQTLVPKQFLDDEDIAYSIGHGFCRRGELDSGELWLRRGLMSKPDSIDLKMALGECLAEQVSRAGKLYPGSALTIGERNKLDEALTLLDSGWSALRTSQLGPIALQCATNLSTILLVLNQPTRALDVVDQGLARDGSNQDLLRQNVRLSLDAGLHEVARDALKTLRPSETSDYVIFQAEILRRSGNEEEAISVLEKFISEAPDSEELQLAKGLFVDLTVARFGFLNVRTRLETVLPRGHLDYRSLIAFADAAHRAGDINAAEESLIHARKQFESKDDARPWLILADTLFNWKRYDDALDIYRQYCSPLNDNTSLRKYVGALMEGDRRKELADLLARVPNSVKEKTFFQRVLGELAYQSGDLRGAQPYFERCIKEDPEDFRTRIRWAELLIALGDKLPVEQYLRLHKSNLANPEEVIHLGRIHQLAGNPTEAARLFYEARRKFPASPEAHLAITSLLLFSQDLHISTDTTGPIALDMAFAVRDKHDKEHVFIVEERQANELREGELRPDHPLAIRALGLTVGSNLVLSETPYVREQGTVVWVKHKYLHALHETRNPLKRDSQTLERCFAFQWVKVTTRNKSSRRSSNP